MPVFPCPDPITLNARLGGGAIEVFAEERTTATVDITPYDSSDAAHAAAEQTSVELRDGRLVVKAPESGGGFLFRRSPRVRLHIRVPLDSTIDVKVASADLTGHGRLAAASIESASGDVYLEHVTGDVSARTASGDLRLVRVDGQLQLNTASGDLSAQLVGGDVTAHSASGDLDVEQVGASFNATTASGDIAIGAARRGTVAIKSASGDVSIGVEAGTGVWLDLTTVSGRTRSDLAAADPAGTTSRADLTVAVRTMSGDIHVRRVSMPATA